MPGFNEPLLVNILGHAAGALIFAIFLFLLFSGRGWSGLRGRYLSGLAAMLSLVWNLGSLIVLVRPGLPPGVLNFVIALSFSVLSLLPAVLLHLSLEDSQPTLVICGYILSGIAVAAHFREIAGNGATLHQLAILLITVGFLLLDVYKRQTLLNTTITFPIAWHNSKTDGVTGRLSTTNLHGFQAYETFGHSRARYFPPEDGGLIPQGAELAPGVFRIDHDQAFQSTGVFRYQHKTAEWIAFTWRYDSGMVVSGVPDAAAAMALTPNQEVTIGLACNGVYASVAAPITACNGTVTSKLLTLPQTGQENDDHNPDRVKPRNVFNLGLGTDNLFHKEGRKKFTASLDIANLANKEAIYNFLSTFSGTHFLQPRTVSARIGIVF